MSHKLLDEELNVVQTISWASRDWFFCQNDTEDSSRSSLPMHTTQRLGFLWACAPLVKTDLKTCSNDPKVSVSVYL